MPNAYAYFRVFGEDLPLEEITRQIGIEPTESWRKGDPWKYFKAVPTSSWCLHSPLPRTLTDLQAHVEAVLELLVPRRGAVRALSERFATSVVCVGTYDSTTSPGLYLSRDVVALMASMGLALDADLYFGEESAPSTRGEAAL